MGNNLGNFRMTPPFLIKKTSRAEDQEKKMWLVLGPFSLRFMVVPQKKKKSQKKLLNLIIQ